MLKLIIIFGGIYLLYRLSFSKKLSKGKDDTFDGLIEDVDYEEVKE